MVDHAGQHRAAGVERAVQINGHHPPPVLVGGVGEQLDLRDARIADEHLQTAEFLLGPGNGGAHLGGVARVGPDGKIAAAGVDFFGLTAHGVGGIGVGIVRKGDVIARPGKGQHRRRTDAAAAAGDENVICHGKTSIHCPLTCLPLGGRCPEGAEGESLAMARNISDDRKALSPTACGRSPLPERAKEKGAISFCAFPAASQKNSAAGPAPRPPEGPIL